MKWFHRRRLIRLADKLEGKGPYTAAGPVPEHKFDMRWLFTKRRGGGESNRDGFNPLECKTAACALGWGLSDPWFVKRGLARHNIDSFLGFATGFFVDEELFNRLFEARFYGSHGGRRVHPSIVAARLRQAAQDG